ncbi:hypothetical protein N9N67_01810 [Bacteriovoracaceae bacterium]|nr:hypothetical protein [Bacteriovoracaceae bacterium]
MKFLVLLTLLFSGSVLSDVGMLYAPGAHNMGIGSQPDMESQDCSNTYYAPALNSFIDSPKISLNSLVVHHNLYEMNDIVVQNSLNSDDDIDFGDIDPNESTSAYHMTHFCFPFIKQFNTFLNISVTAPVTQIMEAKTVDSYEPTYYFENTQEKRTILRVSFTHKVDKYLAYSVGQKTSFNVFGETSFVSRYQGDDDYSSGEMDIQTKPSSALIISAAYFFNEESYAFFSFIDELKTEMVTTSEGFTPLGDAIVPYDFTITSIIYYDPRVISFGHGQKINNFYYAVSLEYHDWSGYESSKMKITRNSGIIKKSKNYETIKTNNIFVPKFGLKYNHGKSFFSGGYFYRPRAIISNLNSSGNTIDLNSHNFTLGYERNLSVFKWPLSLSVGYMLREYEDLSVDKSSDMENGDDGKKIGYGGFTAGGQVHSMSFGINWKI